MASLGMWMMLDSSVYRRFHDLILPSLNGTTQVDHVIVSCYGIFVVETKNYQGWIFGSAEQKKWTQVVYGNKYSFQNPLHQNYRHIKSLERFLGLPSEKFISVVFFIGECTFKTDMPPNVIESGFATFIRSHHRVLLDQSELMQVIEKLENLRINPQYTAREHRRSLEQRHGSDSQCPRCGGSLVTRTARRGPNAGGQFIGCSNFPRCRYTR